MKILLIALHYHDYTGNIADELRRLGHTVTVHDIMPRDFTMKALRLAAPGLWQSRLDRHHARILRQEKDTPYDMVLFIQVHQMSQANMAAFKAAFPRATFTLYNWDSIANHDYRPHIAAFDHILTFDPDDARTHGFQYLPLFCSREFQNLPTGRQEARAIYFVGNIVNPVRYDMVAAFRDYCASARLTFRAWMACTPPVRFKMYRTGRKPTGLSTGSIDRGAFLAMVESSAATFDFANHHQSGYTMRIFENLCAGKKIITNNARILHEPFYSADRIHVFRGEDFSGVNAFMDTPLRDPDAGFPAYRIQAFARHLVEGRGHPLPSDRSPPQ